MVQEVWSSRAARFRKAVVFCCDGNYLPFALFALAQMDRLHPQRRFDLCLVSSTELDLPPGLDLDLRRIVLDGTARLAGLNLDDRRTVSAYLRMLLPSVLEADYDRILYLDSDIWVKGGDFDGLFSIDLRGHPVGAVRDNQQWRTPGRMVQEFRDFNLPNAPYFNSGVILFDVASWKAQAVESRALEFGARHGARLMRHDQTLLNCVLHRNWAELSPVWNWQYTWSTRLLEPMADANILHFIGSRKPWNSTRGEYPPQFRRNYAAFIANYFPGLASIKPEVVYPATNGPFLRKMLLKHLLSNRSMMRYLSRFPDELAVG